MEHHLEQVSVADAMDKQVDILSIGMKQRVGIARAFTVSPELLLLEKPFGMLDIPTRWEWQEVLMAVRSRTKLIATCGTRNLDEAILVADRAVMLINGPQTTIGKITQANLTRPRV